MERFKTLLSFLGRCLPHLLIINSLILITLILIDRVNAAMNFINNSLTKSMLFITCVVAVFCAVLLIIRQRRELPDGKPEQYIDDEALYFHDESSEETSKAEDEQLKKCLFGQ